MANNNYNKSATDNLLLILKFNANELKNHALELKSVLNNKRIDIALISGTHFTQYSHNHIHGYKLIKSNHPDNTAHGSTAIFVKSNIEFFPLASFSQSFLQFCAINQEINNIPFTITSVYFQPPKHKVTNIQFADYFNSFNNFFIIGGGFQRQTSVMGMPCK
jgi:hypothetical protein